MAVLPCGDRALLVELADLAAVAALDDALRRTPPAGAVEVVPAARTVLIRFAAGSDLAGARRALAELTDRIAPAAPAATGELIEVPTRYDGADLADVADAIGLTPAEVIAAHTAAEWTVAFCGFAPGFAYLTGGDPRLGGIPRHRSPRTRVPAGSVALAGGFSAVYPRESPGGWQLLGRTDLAVFDPDRDPAVLLRPGGRVRFVAAAW